MKHFFSILSLFLLFSISIASAQTTAPLGPGSGGGPSGGGGGGSGTVSSATIGQVAVYSGSTTVSGYAGLTYAQGTGQMVLDAGVALGATTALLINPTSASGLLLDAQVNGTSKAHINNDGTTTIGSGGTGATNIGLLVNAGSALTGGGYIGVQSNGASQGFIGTSSGVFGSAALGNANDFNIEAVFQNINIVSHNGLASQFDANGTQAQSYRIYHDWSSNGSVYSRMELGFNAHSGIAAIDVAAATSTLPNFGIYFAGSIAQDYNISQPNYWFFSHSVATSGNFQAGVNGGIFWAGRANMQSTADGVIFLSNNAGTNSASISFPTATATPTFQFGAANAASPVAQTISFQGALAGSATNQASVNTTIIGSLGTGTGTNGDIVFQTGVKTSTGTAQATATPALTIKGETQGAIFTGPVAVGAANAIGSAFSIGVGGTGASNSIVTAENTSGQNMSAISWNGFSSLTGLHMVSIGSVSWNANAAGFGGAWDTSFYRVAANIVGLASTPATGSSTAASLQVANILVGPTNREYAVFGFDNGAGGASSTCDGATTNTLCIGTWNSGTGVARPIHFIVGGTNYLTIATSGAISLNGNSITINGTSAFTQSTAAKVLGSMNSAGANYGNIANLGADSWALGYSGTATGLGTAVITWTDNGTVTIAPNNSITTITGSLTISALANVATTSAVCYNTGTGVLTYDGTLGTCTVSGRQFKNILGGIDTVADIGTLRPAVYRYKPESGFDDGRVHVGLIAQDVARMDDRCAVRNADGEIINFEDRCLLAHLIADNDNLRAELRNLRRSIGR